MKHIISFSSGLSSALVGARVIEKFGKDNTVFVFMDTTTEDADNYRFLSDYKKHFNVPIKTLCVGKTPFEVLEAAKMVGSQYAAKCTEILKIIPFRNFLETLGGEPLTIHIGYDFSEVERCDATTEAYKKLGYAVDYPLLWKPYEYRKYSQVAREDWNIEPPRMYALGYKHANCGGQCVKAGRGDWKRTYINFPERYEEAESWEAHMIKNVTAKLFTILRDQSNQEVKPVTLKEFRELITPPPEELDFFPRVCIVE
ncbi:MAG: phosphoadenosine phosphosulfate reductase family protein [Planctomycetes bacterium]|nr:phosphoadenosine phosphosulfate reductase family protein [Planctomycetota bacterium]